MKVIEKHSKIRVLKDVLVLGFIFVLYSCNPTKYIQDKEYLLDDYQIKVIGKDKGISKDELDALVKQKPNHKIFSSLKLHLAIYNLINPDKEKKRQALRDFKLKQKNKERLMNGKEPIERTYFTQWVLNIGEKPVIYSKHKTKRTNAQFEQYLKNKGYYEAHVRDSLIKEKKKIKVFYVIKPGKPYIIDSIRYSSEDSIIGEFVKNDKQNSLIKRGGLFDVDLLDKERRRIATFLKNKGYYAFDKQFIYFVADSTQKNKRVNLTFGIKKNKVLTPSGTKEIVHKKYIIDTIFIYTNYDPKTALIERDNYIYSFQKRELSNPKIQFLKTHDFSIKPKTILRENYIFTDSIYSLSNVTRTFDNLNSLKSFKLINIVFHGSNDTIGSASSPARINCDIQLTPYVRQSYTIELEGSNSSGNWGIAGNFTYRHRNLFGGAENLKLRIRGAREAQSDVFKAEDSEQSTKLLNTHEYGFDASIDFPKFMLPFRTESLSRDYDVKTMFTTSYNYQNRPDYNRTLANIDYGYYWRSKKLVNFKHYVNPVNFHLVKVTEENQAFLDYIDTLYIKYSYTDQVIPASSYSLIIDNQQLKKFRDSYYFQMNLELAGNLLTAYNKLSGTEKKDGTYRLFSIDYAQYVRGDFDFRYYHKLQKEDHLVFRAFLGLAYPYGNSEKGLPFVKKYYAGGANSIRAWQVRSLGPGSYIQDRAQTFPNLTADMKLEANFEYRFKLFYIFEGAVFVDAGNIWAIREQSDDRDGALFNFNDFYHEIAVGAGAGLRLDFSFFIFRSDLGIKLRDPQALKGQRWIPTNRKYERTDWTINIGIGYPF